MHVGSCQAGGEVGYRGGASLDVVINEFEKAIFSVSDQMLPICNQPFSQLLGSLYEQAEERSQNRDYPGVTTGFNDLDHLLQGMQPSDLIIIAGRPGMGKTSFLLSIIRHASRVHKKHVEAFTLETTREQLAQRLVSQELGIDTELIRSGKLQEDEWQLFAGAIENLSHDQLFVDDRPCITVHQMTSTCRKLHKENKLDLVVIDYLQLLSSGERFENCVQEVSFITRQLKVLAR